MACQSSSSKQGRVKARVNVELLGNVPAAWATQGAARNRRQASQQQHCSLKKTFATNSKCKAQGALNIMTTCLRRAEGTGWSTGALGGTGSLTLNNLGSDGWLVITGKWRAFAPQHSISTVSLRRASKGRGANRQNLIIHMHTRTHTQFKSWNFWNLLLLCMLNLL